VINDLTQIGFYTLSDARCQRASVDSDLQRCELILSARCNFSCPYCRHIGGPDLPFEDAVNIVKLWGSQHLKNIRFSGGEPTLYPRLVELVSLAKEQGCEHIAISTNGSAKQELYDKLLNAGANDFSISLDACCAADGDIMSGTRGQFDKVAKNIQYLSTQTYVTVGVVLTDQNQNTINKIIEFADSLGVSDIRIIPAAQNGNRLHEVYVNPELLQKYPILAYRISNLQNNIAIRGLENTDSIHCGLVLDDMAVCENKHYPCIIYMRESGKEIGKVGPNMRQERLDWHNTHNVLTDPICSKNCLDVCSEYNRRFELYHSK
jgi:MoaA/NifB/PqqE/SkfB family radical SAM enzyme